MEVVAIQFISHTRSTLFTCAVYAVALALAALVFGAASARAAARPVPAGQYPAGASISYQASLSNHQMDCRWGFFCEGNVPLFHYLTQDQLHRQGGWAEFADVHDPGHRSMAFELFASRYVNGVDSHGRAWSAAAFSDFLQATHAHGYLPLSHPRPVIAPIGNGTALLSLDLGDSELVVMAGWMGTTEVEAIARFNARSPQAKREAITSLIKQVRQAMKVHAA